MKHIMKKTAIFMASAILLGLAAPTSTAGAETVRTAGELKVAYQYGEATEKITLQIDEKEDMRFLGAPLYWKVLSPTWTAVDPEIASVDRSGVITANASGTTVVMIQLSNGMFGYVLVEVIENEPVIEDEPAVEEEPAIKDEPVAEEEPTTKDEPVVEEEPTIKDEPVVEEEPTTKDEPVVEEEPTVKDEPVIEPKPVVMTTTQISKTEFTVSFENVEYPELVTKEDFKVTEHCESEFGGFTYDWPISKVTYDEKTNTLTVSGDNYLLREVTYIVSYQPEGTSLAESSFVSKKIEPEDTSLKLMLNNQEYIRVASNATFADGTPVTNMLDIAKYAFSYATTNGDIIVPTYDTDPYGVAEIVDVEYGAVKGAHAVIVRYVHFKIYLDPNNDGKVTAEEKTSGSVGYYIVKVPVDKTITIDNWDMVQ